MGRDTESKGPLVGECLLNEDKFRMPTLQYDRYLESLLATEKGSSQHLHHTDRNVCATGESLLLCTYNVGTIC